MAFLSCIIPCMPVYLRCTSKVTFPDDKYYNLEAWHAKQAARKAKAAKKGLPMELEKREATAGSFSILQDESDKRRKHTARNMMTMSREQLAEMRQIERERTSNNVRKDLGQKQDEKAGIRTQSKMRGLLGFGEKAM